jgi:predicted N-formylglutamate amidohydrolase
VSGAIAHVVTTCEHATNRVPEDLSALFRAHRALLKTHRGWDIGAMGVAERLAAGLASPLFVGEASRLVVELNRSPDSPSLFSDITRALPEERRRAILERYYTPWRCAVREHVARWAAQGPVLHVSVHSFTPVLNGKRRTLEVGLLFDPARESEKALCERWRRAILADEAGAGLRVKMNLPYRGTSDGHTTALRREFAPERYLGVEVEVNNALIARRGGQERVGLLLTRTLRRVLER